MSTCPISQTKNNSSLISYPEETRTILKQMILTIKAPNENCSGRHFNFLLLSFEEIRLDVSCESSARQRIHMKYQVLVSLKNNEKVLMNVVCYSRHWRLKG